MVSPRDLVQQLSSNPKLRALLEQGGGKDALARLDEWANESLADSGPLVIESPETATLEAALAYAHQVTNKDDRQLLDHSEAITIDGTRWLRLLDESRGAVLRAATKNRSLDSLLVSSEAADLERLAEAAPDKGLDVELASAWLRQFLRGHKPRFGELSVRHLRAVTAAVGSLSACRDVIAAIPDVEQAERWLGLAELRQPLEILVGQRSPGEDRFVGREKEMRQLRGFVDVLGSQSVSESVSRGLKRIRRAVANLVERPSALGLTLVADGGLGKSALVAKFALNHFLQPEGAIPFIYFDFDRASLQPREPDQLLIEAARQISLEMPSLAERLSAIRRRLRNDMSDRDRVYEEVVASEALTSAPATDPYVEFGTILREAAKSTPSGVALLVLDTMEMVQSDPEAINGIVHFLRRLCERPFRELRIVAAGRAEVAELSQITGLVMAAENIELKPLGVTDAREMVDRLGRVLMNEEWNEDWTRALVGGDREPGARRVPLTLRVALELLRDALPSEREGLVRYIAELGATATNDLVGRIYVRRIINHVRDKDARALAWPGLVARRITPDVLKSVIAPIAGLHGAGATAAFEKLEREVWIVERDGDALVHRSDLRARTLPFMRRYNREVFDRLVHSLRDYYWTRGDAVEASYYRLLSGEHPEFLLEEVEGSMFDRLASAAEDFAADWQPEDMPYARLTYSYLRSRRGPLMARRLFETLPAELEFSHLRRAGAGVSSLDDTKVHSILSACRNAEVAVSRMGRDDLLARQTLLIKTGEWTPLQHTELLLPSETRDAVALAFYIARGGLRQVSPDLVASLVSAFNPSVGGGAWRVGAFLLPFLRAYDPDLFRRCDAELARMSPERVTDRPASVGAVRSALSAAQESFPLLTRRWAELTAQQGEDAARLSVSEALALREILSSPEIRSRFPSQTSEEQYFAIAQRATVQDTPHWFDSTAVPRFSEWLARNPIKSQPLQRNLRAFLVARYDDWVVPVGYAIQSELSKRETIRSLDELFQRHAAYSSRPWMQALTSNSSKALGDGISIAKRANEASDLVGLLTTVRQHASNAASSDIAVLEDALGSWIDLLSQHAGDQII